LSNVFFVMISKKRVVVVQWKTKPENPFEVFSSLKNFCLSYQGYNYNTISNYLSKRKIAYDNPQIRIERKDVFQKPKPKVTLENQRTIIPITRKVKVKEADDAKKDLTFWLKKTPLDRIGAVTELIMQSMTHLKRMDKTRIAKRKLSL
jgi:effector-binding domain-containing protein